MNKILKPFFNPMIKFESNDSEKSMFLKSCIEL